MLAAFTGDPKDPSDATREVVIFGMVFPRGEPVDVSHLSDGQKDKLRGNSHFEVAEDVLKRKPGRPRKEAAPEAEADGQDEN